MKLRTLTITALFLSLGHGALAGVTKFNSDEFNSIISESQESEKTLRAQLRENAGMPDLQKELNERFEKKDRQVVGVIEGETRVASTTEYSFSRVDRSGKKLHSKSMKRVAEELSSSEID